MLSLSSSNEKKKKHKKKLTELHSFASTGSDILVSFSFVFFCHPNSVENKIQQRQIKARKMSKEKKKQKEESLSSTHGLLTSNKFQELNLRETEKWSARIKHDSFGSLGKLRKILLTLRYTTKVDMKVTVYCYGQHMLLHMTTI